MQAHDEFWLQLHDLASDLDSDNMPEADKVKLLAEYLVLYPPVARQQIEDEFYFVLKILTALKDAIASAPPSRPREAHKGDGHRVQSIA